MNGRAYQPALHRIALLTTAATFPLIFMGGLVTSHQAGMSVPDWPNSYGYNMFLFPPSQWVGGIFYEHTHRLLGTVVGFCSILLVLFAWGPARNPIARRRLRIAMIVVFALAAAFALGPFTYNNNETLTRNLHHAATGTFSVGLVLLGAFVARSRDDRRWVRWLSVGVLVAVVVQGVLGGLRVVLVELDLAVIHACFAQAFFCLAALMAAVTSRWWLHAGPQPGDRPVAAAEMVCPCSDWTVRLAIIAVLTIYLQLIAGAVMRHYQAGLAIPDLPLAYGAVLPPTDAAGLETVNQWRSWHPELSLDRVTLAQIWIHFAHRIGAVLVTVAIAALVLRVLRRQANEPLLVRPAVLLIVLLVAQLTLGVLTVLWQKPADVATLHVAVGALTLVTTFILAVRAMRLTRRTARQAAGGFEPLPHDSTHPFPMKSPVTA